MSAGFEHSTVFSDHAESLRSFIATDACAKDLLQKVPWVLDWSRQTQLQNTLINEAGRLAVRAHEVKFSFVVPLWNTPPRLLRELLTSIRIQSWPNWEILLVDDASTQTSHLEVAEHFAKDDRRFRIFRNQKNLGIAGARNTGISNATGQFIGFIDHDDLVHPQAFGIFARIAIEEPAINFIFSNEVKINEDSTRVSDFLQKPEFHPATLLRVNYVAHLTAIHRSLLETATVGNGSYFRSGFDGVEDHDLFLRLGLGGKVKARHVPLFCYYWRKVAGSTAIGHDAKPKVDERGILMLRSLLGPDSSISGRDPSEKRNRFMTVRRPLKNAASLLVVMPFRDQPDMTIRCLESIIKQNTSLQVSVVAVSNLSSAQSEAKVQAWMDREAGRKGFTFKLHHYKRPFNYAAMNNEVIQTFSAGCDFVLLLNNDVELNSPEALSAMGSELQHHPDIGFVGIKLWYPGRTEIQHGGMKLRNVLRGPGYFRVGHAASSDEFAHDDHVVPGVTFACAMTRMSVWKSLGGLEETYMPNGLGDMDMCMRALKAGFSCFYLGTVEGTHHESKTRGDAAEDLELYALYKRHSDALMASRTSFMAYNIYLDWNGLTTARKSDANSDCADYALDLPLRYRLADAINHFLKAAMRPLHGFLKAVFR